METITITTENHETYCAVSNFFIDYYMTKANGEYVKIYLYLVRLLNSGRIITVADIADHFELTEKDICRAIRYWIKEGVLRLEYTADKKITGITMLPLKAKATASHSDSLLFMLAQEEEEKAAAKPYEMPIPPTAKPDKKAAQKELSDANSIQASASIPKRAEYKAAYIEDKKNMDDDFGDILYQTETYFAKPLTRTDLQILTYIYEELSFSPDLLAYLVEYCVSIGKKSSRYIESVAIDWYKNGITTVDEAKVASKNYNSIYVAVLKQLGIPRRVPTPAETAFIDTWYNTYAFDKTIIIEACRRAVLNNPQSASFHYVNGILENWHRQNVHKISDIEALDEKWEKEHKKQSNRKNSTTSNPFPDYKNSTSEETMNEFASLFLDATNQ